jgi:hypothetical protein
MEMRSEQARALFSRGFKHAFNIKLFDPSLWLSFKTNAQR